MSERFLQYSPQELANAALGGYTIHSQTCTLIVSNLLRIRINTNHYVWGKKSRVYSHNTRTIALTPRERVMSAQRLIIRELTFLTDLSAFNPETKN